MDYWSRIILASIIGAGTGLGIAYFFGHHLIFVFIFLAIALATETSLRTIRNVKIPPNPLINREDQIKGKDGNIVKKQGPEPKF